MRKLIIIGNGFDRAHGLDTDYGSFVRWYLVKQVTNLFENATQTKETELITLSKGSKRLSNFGEVKAQGKILEFLKREMDRPDYLKFNFNSNIFKIIYGKSENENKDLRWVDIENEYFTSLRSASNNEEKVKNLNNQFFEIRAELIEYLGVEQKRKQDEGIPFSEEMLDSFYENKDSDYNFLIFNYTKTVEQYIIEFDRRGYASLEKNYIHGSLTGKDGDPIFGIGNENDKSYIAFKEDNLLFKELLKYSKSQWYLRNENYSNLAKFINKTKTLQGITFPVGFEVSIYGHSCGSSDATLLSHIFQHEGCKSIKLYYHNNDEDFYDRVLDLERYFEDPLMFREKVRSLAVCEAMPQPKDDN